MKILGFEIFGKKEVTAKEAVAKAIPEIEMDMPHPSTWPSNDPREEARIGRLVDAINRYKELGQHDRVLQLRVELARRLGVI